MAEIQRVGIAGVGSYMPSGVLRNADLERMVELYGRGLGFEVLGRFVDHDGYDGAMLGAVGADHHLEFTRQHGHPAPRAPTAEHLLVYYLPDRDEWEAACDRMQRAGFTPVAAQNPSWDRRGRTFEDPEGYRVVLQNATWPE